MKVYPNDDKTHVDPRPHNDILWGLKSHSASVETMLNARLQIPQLLQSCFQFAPNSCLPNHGAWKKSSGLFFITGQSCTFLWVQSEIQILKDSSVAGSASNLHKVTVPKMVYAER